MLHDAFAVRGPCVDAEGEGRSRRHCYCFRLPNR
jgi:hypothetical protein